MTRIRSQDSGGVSLFHLGVLMTAVFFGVAPAQGAPVVDRALLAPAELAEPPDHVAVGRWRPVRLKEDVLGAALVKAAPIEIELFNGSTARFEHRKTIFNRSGSTSWVGDLEGPEPGLAVLVVRDGLVIGSIRSGSDLYLLSYAGRSADGEHVHVLHQIDESVPQYGERPPVLVHLDPVVRRAAERETRRRLSGGAAQDDGSTHDLLVVYSQRAMDEVGGLVAMENLIDLGVTETNLSYEFSGIQNRLRLVHTFLTDYVYTETPGDPRDQLQDPNDGVMDDVHALRDQVAADLVMVISGNFGGCGSAFIMNEISIAHEEFAFCSTNHVCVSPGYTFQHELGHIQSGRHQRSAPQPDSPFTTNFGFSDADNEFRTIMAAGSQQCPNGCPRRLAWSNPDVNDLESGTPMGIPETDPLPADMRKALNATAWTVANFRVSNAAIFSDGFESGNTSAWDPLKP